VLRAQFPGTVLAPDVTALQQLPPEADLVAAGFPCIDVSRAGLRRGVHDGSARHRPFCLPPPPAVGRLLHTCNFGC
jgi:site-specific DNA-cytosine methylase